MSKFVRFVLISLEKNLFQSMNVGSAVAESNWYDFSPKVKKALFLIILRSQKPCMLSLGGFYQFNLKTYLMVSSIYIVTRYKLSISLLSN